VSGEDDEELRDSNVRRDEIDERDVKTQSDLLSVIQ